MSAQGLLIERAIANWRDVVRIPTVSRLRDEGVDWEPFVRFRREIAERYPALHETLELDVVNGYALLFRWVGRGRAAPTVLMAHYDVVPAVDDGWSCEPFGGDVVDLAGEQTLVSRGSIDDKASLVGILEAVEYHAAAGFTPSGDIYLSFSHNEEVLGNGAPGVVELLESRGIRPRLVLDEGGIVGESIFGPVDADVAYVGVSEKGTASVRITATGPGGHASVPPQDPSTHRVARAIFRIQQLGGWPILNDATRTMIATVGPHAKGPFRAAAELLSEDEAAAIREFSSVSRDANAMTHSLPVVTMLNAGQTTNAIPETASAVVNLRVSAGHPFESVISWLRDTIDDPEIQIEVLEARDASPVSPATGPEWELLVRNIRRTYGDVLVVPYVNNGGTDSRNFTPICDTVYRFSPYAMALEERRSIHAVDERLSIRSFVEGLDFYRSLVAEL